MRLSSCLKANENFNNVLFKHVNNKDIAFKIDSIIEQNDNTSFHFAITWFNVVNPNKVFVIDYDLIKIKTSDLDKWEKIDVQAGRILRNNL